MGIYSASEKKFDFEILKEPHGVFDYSNFNNKVDGRFNYVQSGVEFECFFKKSTSQKLFVFLNSASSRVKDGPIFHRISWTSSLDANMLYFEDPMYLEHDDLKCSWYYGRENKSYLKLIIDIVNDVAEKNKIERENIVFVGSSAGGYAAIFCANYMLGAKAYAYNPQIVLNKWPGAKKFIDITKFDLLGQDEFGRNDISYFLKNSQSKFFIHCNYRSSVDMLQINSISKALNVEKEGFYKTDNLYFALTPLKIRDYHICVVDQDDFIFGLEILFEKVDFLGDASMAYFRKFIKNTVQKDRIFCSNHWAKIIEQGVPEFLLPPNRKDKNKLDFECDDGLKVFFYRILFDFSDLSFNFIFYIQCGSECSKNFLNDIRNSFLKENYEVAYHEERGFLKIFLQSNDVSNINKNFSEFCEKTYFLAFNLYKASCTNKDLVTNRVG